MVLRFFLLSIFLFFIACADGERDNPEDPGSKNYIPRESSSSVVAFSSSGALKEYEYCVYDKFCAEGPFTTCQGDGILSNKCPYNSSSSTAEPPPSSSSVVPSSSSAPTQSGIIRGTPVNYGGEDYETVVIGTQTWMASNLNYRGTEPDTLGICYDNSEANCDIYGRLYNWATAMNLPSSCNSSSCASQIGTKHQGICPSGWHIPSDADAEWTTLTDYVGGASSAGKYLKATNGWNNYNGQSGNGEDNFGFAALPGGNGDSYGNFFSVGDYGNWWSATENNAYYAYTWSMYYDYENAERYYGNKSDGLFSVRCLQD